MCGSVCGGAKAVLLLGSGLTRTDMEVKGWKKKIRVEGG